MVHRPLLGVRAQRFGEDEMHTPDTEDTAHTTVLGPDVKYVQLADNHRTSWGRAMPSPVKVRAF